MKRLLALVLVLCCVAPVDAGHRRKNVVVVQSGLVVTPFAIPVAVPVTVVPFAPVVYAYSTGASVKNHCQQPSEAAVQGEPVKSQEVKPNIVHQKCGKCHSGPNAKGGLSLFNELEFGLVEPVQLTAEQRLACIDQIVQQKMPKGGTLSPSEIGELVQHFSAAKAEEK